MRLKLVLMLTWCLGQAPVLGTAQASLLEAPSPRLQRRIPLPFDGNASASPLSSPESSIAAADGEHVVLHHRDFPHMTVRIKQLAKPNQTVIQNQNQNIEGNFSTDIPIVEQSNREPFCKCTGKSWSGYIDLRDGKSLLFFFFESERDPSKDPVLLWLSGGPGCSSAGAVLSQGPCTLVKGNGTIIPGPPINGTKFNPHSWTNIASVIFLDQPVNVGFSYSRYGVETLDSEQGVKDVYAFLRIFFSAFPKYHENDFMIAGSSYAGRYVPRYASQIVDENQRLMDTAEQQNMEVNKTELIRLTKIAIGNGVTDIAVQTPSWYDFTCTRKGGIEPVLSIETCKMIRPWKEKCLKWTKDVCVDSFNLDECGVAGSVCHQKFSDPFDLTNRTRSNVHIFTCTNETSPTPCLGDLDLRMFYDRDDVRKAIGAEPVSKIGSFHPCNDHVGEGFGMRGDGNWHGVDSVSGLLERHIEVMLYIGKLDWTSDWLGNRAWVDEMDWTDKEAFEAGKLYTYKIDGKDAGQTQKGGGLTWVTIEGAGHSAPEDQPRVTLEVIKKFLAGKKL